MPLTTGSGCRSGSCYFSSSTFKMPTKNLLFLQSFLLIPFWRYIYIILQRQKFKKKSQTTRNQGFSYYFCLVIEGSGSGSILLTNGSGSGSMRPNNKRIRRIRIRILNNYTNYSKLTLKEGKNVKSQDSPVPRNASDMTGVQDSRAPNTAWSAILIETIAILPWKKGRRWRARIRRYPEMPQTWPGGRTAVLRTLHDPQYW